MPIEASIPQHGLMTCQCPFFIPISKPWFEKTYSQNAEFGALSRKTEFHILTAVGGFLSQARRDYFYNSSGGMAVCDRATNDTVRAVLL